MAGYLDIAAMKAYWAEQGYVPPVGTTDQQLSPAWNRGAAVIDRYEQWFSGVRSGGFEQAHSWGRNGASTYYGQAIPDGVVPLAISHASFEGAWLEFNNPGVLMPVVTGSATVKSEKIGQIQVEYAASSSTSIADLVAMATPVVTTIEGLLWPFLNPVLPGILVV